MASVSCIYGLGNPEDYQGMVIPLEVGKQIERDDLLRRLVDLQYERNDIDFGRARFRVRGDCVDVQPAYEEFGHRIEFFGDQIDRLALFNPLTGEILGSERQTFIYPAKHFVLPESRIEQGCVSIEQELTERLTQLRNQGKLLEAQRPGGPHEVRPRDAPRGGLLPRHRELQPPPLRRATRRAAVLPPRTISPTITLSSSMRAT